MTQEDIEDLAEAKDLLLTPLMAQWRAANNTARTPVVHFVADNDHTAEGIKLGFYKLVTGPLHRAILRFWPDFATPGAPGPGIERPLCVIGDLS